VTTNTCIGALATKLSCAIGVSFTPTAAGPISGSISITDDALGSPQVVQLSGTGVASYPVPAITGITPSSAVVGSPAFSLSVSGTGFFPASVIRVNGVDHATTYNSSTSLTTTLAASEVASLGDDSVTVFNPAPGGGVSNTANLTPFISIPLSAVNM